MENEFLAKKHQDAEEGPSVLVRVGPTPFTGYDEQGTSLEFIKLIRKSIRVPFLEESIKIFVKELIKIDPCKLYGVIDKPLDYQRNYMKFVENFSRTKGYANRPGILQIKEVRIKNYIVVWYQEFDVQRRDLQESTFSEADFENLNIADLEFIYHEFRRRTVRPRAVVFALEAVKRDLEFLTPVVTPELGVIYVNTETHKEQFMRASEVEKFSDGTLKMVLRELEEKHKHSEMRRLEMGEHMPKSDRIAMERMIRAIRDRIEFREGISRFESFLDMRIKSFRRWNR
ncbi:hypothetical protein L6452_18090 [Arctium lappa]|uniref:Uncharacterized protein n=1 Tax=Arctium lappa TaxID=4217 RepID=A0ACB9C5G4_ARCLA|nr:hypothetical protein L6452_18090 [Arctium lappa]